MISLRPVIFTIGLSLIALAGCMIFPLLADINSSNEGWKVFTISMVITGFFGGALVFSNRTHPFELSTKQAFLATISSWIVVTIFAAMPFKFSELDLNTENAIFEAMSGLTTTGATVIDNLKDAPPGILMWRASLQWLGGIAILVMALLVLPYLRVGGMQIFQSENNNAERVKPRLIKHLQGIIGVYIVLSIICGICYSFAGFNPFNAMAYAMTTVSTGGFAPHDGSFISETRISPQIVAIIFMAMSGMPFIMFLKALQRKASNIFVDSQTRAYILVLLGSSLILSIWLALTTSEPASAALLTGTFTAISTMTGTGFANTDYSVWSGFGLSIIAFLMVIGGCAGSTTCGIKIFRFQILYAVSLVQIKKLLHPSAIFIPRYQNKPVKNDAIISVMAFFFVFAITFVASIIALSLTGVDLITALSATVACLSNVGPGFGDIIGPAQTYEPLSQAAKWILITCMFLGRLEFFTALVLLSPYFWRK